MTYNELIESIMTAQEMMLQHDIEANSVTLNGRKYGKLIENLPPNIKPTIFGMAVKADYALPDDYDFLVQREPPQPITIADRIRSMTDEELAEWIFRDQMNIFKMACDAFGYTEYDEKKMERWDDILSWLRQEAGE